MKNVVLVSTLVLLFTAAVSAQEAPAWKLPIEITSTSFSNTLSIGIHPDANYGIDDFDTNPGIDPDYYEAQLPPTPPPPYDFDVRFTTLPGRPSAVPLGFGTGLQNDFRHFFGSTQVDSFRVYMSGSSIENNGATITWPDNLDKYADSWVIQPLGPGSWGPVDMIANTEAVLPAAFGPLQALIIKVGAKDPTVGIEDYDATIPEGYSLSQNYPNPFNPTTTFSYSIPERANVTVVLSNAAGEVHKSSDEVRNQSSGPTN